MGTMLAEGANLSPLIPASLRSAIPKSVWDTVNYGRRITGVPIMLQTYNVFANMTVDKETAEGSERTFKLDGFPAYEKTNTAGGTVTSELSVLVNKRFLVTLEGQGVDVAALTTAFQNFELDGLPKGK